MDELETQEEAERKRREAAEAEAKVWSFIFNLIQNVLEIFLLECHPH